MSSERIWENFDRAVCFPVGQVYSGFTGEMYDIAFVGIFEINEKYQ